MFPPYLTLNFLKVNYMSNAKLTQPVINRARLESLVKQAKEIQAKFGRGATFEIGREIECIERLIPSKSLSAFGSGSVRENAEVGLRNAAKRLAEAVLTFPE